MSRKRVKQINEYLNYINLVLLLGILFLVGNLLLTIRKEKQKVIVKEDGILKVYVFDDKVFNGYLKDKTVRVISLSPLFLEVMPTGVQASKAGEWKVFSTDGIAEVRSVQEEDKFIKGEKKKD